MKRNMITIAAFSFIALFAGAQAQADLIITIGRSDFQPDENLLFNGDGLAEHGRGRRSGADPFPPLHAAHGGTPRRLPPSPFSPAARASHRIIK